MTSDFYAHKLNSPRSSCAGDKGCAKDTQLLEQRRKAVDNGITCSLKTILFHAPASMRAKRALILS